MVRKHPAVTKAGKTINRSDLLQADSLLTFKHRHNLKCFLMTGFVLLTIIPNLLWGESLTNAYFMAVLHFKWLVNSADPYDIVHYCTLSLSDLWVTRQIPNGQYKDYLVG